MKRIFGFLLVITLVLVSFSCMAETSFDTYSQYSTVETISNPVFPQTKDSGALKGNDEEIVNFLARAWYNMLAYETEIKGTKLKDTCAAAIYTAIKKGPGISVFTACDPDAICLNAFFAYNEQYYGTVFWIEWDLETQTIRYIQKYGVDKQKNDKGFLSDYVCNSLFAASMDGNAISGSKSETAVYEAYGTKTQIYKVFEAAYKTATGKKFQIK